MGYGPLKCVCVDRKDPASSPQRASAISNSYKCTIHLEHFSLNSKLVLPGSGSRSLSPKDNYFGVCEKFQYFGYARGSCQKLEADPPTVCFLIFLKPIQEIRIGAKPGKMIEDHEATR